MATHSSVLAWRIPGTGEPGGLPSMGLHRVGHDWSNLAAAAAAVCMWELEHKESRAAKNWCFWTVVLEKTLESPLDCKEVQPVNPKGNQSWIFIGRTDAEAPILWPPDMKNWLLGKDPDAGKEWRQEKKGMMANEMVGWHHRFNGHEFEQALAVGDGQGGLACCSPWGCRVRYYWATELNWTSCFSLVLLVTIELLSEKSVILIKIINILFTWKLSGLFCCFKKTKNKNKDSLR